MKRILIILLCANAIHATESPLPQLSAPSVHPLFIFLDDSEQAFEGITRSFVSALLQKTPILFSGSLMRTLFYLPSLDDLIPGLEESEKQLMQELQQYILELKKQIGEKVPQTAIQQIPRSKELSELLHDILRPFFKKEPQTTREHIPKSIQPSAHDILPPSLVKRGINRITV